MLDTFKSPWFTYVGIIFAIIAIIAGAAGWFDPNIAWGIAGFLGFGSIASLRAYIESKGWKTYVVAGIPMVLGLLVALNVITFDNYQTLIAAFAPLTGITIQQALGKAKK